MLLIHRPQTDPYFNIAAEEYLLKNVTGDCFMLWINEPAVIIGKHQNAFAEINSAFVEHEKIPVIRRISGGGTVFHDPGNLNFSFIHQGDRDKLVDFRKFTRPIIGYLQSLGIPARFEGKNDIRVNGLKVSGNAEHVFRDRVLHHGTLLYNSGLGRLNHAIRGQESNYTDKAVKSVRSTVANVSDFMDQPPKLEMFKEGIVDYMSAQHSEYGNRALSEKEVKAINELAASKYRSWEWNYGYSPRFTFRKQIDTDNNQVFMEATVHAGVIEKCEITGLTGQDDAGDLFLGIRFTKEALLRSMDQHPQKERLKLIIHSIFHEA